MKNKQDIEKLFQDNEHKLHERPSERAWDRLESKLDGNPAISRNTEGRQRPMYRIMGMAATLLFLVAMVALMTTVFRNQENHMTASAESMAPPVMEELKHYDDQKGVYTIAVSYQRYLNKSPRVFAEGPVNKKLIPPANSKRNANASERLLAEAEVKKTEATEKQFFKQENSKVAEKVQKEIFTTQEVTKDYAEVDAIVDTEIPPAVTYAEVEEHLDEVEADDNNGGYGEEGGFMAEHSAPTASSRAAKSKAQSAPTRNENIPIEQLDMASNVISYSSDPNNTGVDQFQWLIGKWQAPLGSDRQTIEQWQQTDEFTIAGSGQLVVNGDTTFTEGMKIQKIGDNLYYILALDENKKEVRFKLRSLDPSMAVFETEEPGVPNQLILQQHNSNNFSTTLQNVAPQEMNQSQLQYLQNRNNVEMNQRTVRNMSRAGK